MKTGISIYDWKRQLEHLMDTLDYVIDIDEEKKDEIIDILITAKNMI